MTAISMALRVDRTASDGRGPQWNARTPACTLRCMATASRKTKPTGRDVEAFLSSVTDQHRRDEAIAALRLMREITGEQPVMWGGSIIGFGRQSYTTADGNQHVWFAIGLSPRKASLTLYGLTFYRSNEDLLEKLGPHTTGKGCIYVKRSDAVNKDALIELVERAWASNNVG